MLLVGAECLAMLSSGFQHESVLHDLIRDSGGDHTVSSFLDYNLMPSPYQQKGLYWTCIVPYEVSWPPYLPAHKREC
jgi:hypothetical protein